MNLKALIQQLRPAQWIKNLFVLAPLFFSREITNLSSLVAGLCAFVCFCMLSSAVYCFNDILDLNTDRMHPRKRMRPLASGALNVPTVVMTAIMLCMGAFILTYMIFTTPLNAIVMMSLYLILNVIYSLGAKNVTILDVMIIATGFVLRVMYGGFTCNIWVSPWLICLTFLITMFMATAKRRDDVLVSMRMGVSVRKSVRGYSLRYLDIVLCMLATTSMVCYIIYTLSADVQERLGTDQVYITAIFVLGGLLRYLQRTLVDEDSSSPTHIILHDHFLLLCGAGWLISFIIILSL